MFLSYAVVQSLHALLIALSLSSCLLTHAHHVLEWMLRTARRGVSDYAAILDAAGCGVQLTANTSTGNIRCNIKSHNDRCNNVSIVR